MTIAAFRINCFLAAIGFYALFGSPTPDHPGWVEAVTGILLVLAVGLRDAGEGLRLERDAPRWRTAGQIFLLYGLAVSLGTGVLRGNAPVLILRDIIPFLFFMLPVFLAPFFAERPREARYVLIAILCAGLIFSLRALAETYLSILSFLNFSRPGEPAYLANAPTVLFAALFLPGTGAKGVLRARTLPDVLKSALLPALAVLPLCAMVLALQRASLGYVCFYALVLSGLALWVRPRRGIVLLLTGFAVLWTVREIPLEIYHAMAQKTGAAGLNMRMEEMSAAWRAIAASPWTAIFGGGWGASFESPAVGGLRVNFTHSLLTSALLKNGLLGLGLCLFYISGLLGALLRPLRHDPVLVLALAGPILIDMFLYASFKSLDFGLILLLAAIFSGPRGKVASAA